MKMIDVQKHPDARQCVRKETTIHRMLSNPNIIQFFGKRSEPTMEYIFLEYASGGELYDRIGITLMFYLYMFLCNRKRKDHFSILFNRTRHWYADL